MTGIGVILTGALFVAVATLLYSMIVAKRQMGRARGERVAALKMALQACRMKDD